MARVYHIEIARFAAHADTKWVDNLLSHFSIPGVNQSRQGLSRRITAEGIQHIALIRLLCRGAGLSLNAAVALGGQLLATEDSPDGQAKVRITDGLEIRFDRAGFQRRVDAAIAEAVESIVPARRGRPPLQDGSGR